MPFVGGSMTGVLQVNDVRLYRRLTPRLMRDRPSHPYVDMSTLARSVGVQTGNAYVDASDVSVASVAAVATDASLAAVSYAAAVDRLGCHTLDGLPVDIFDQLFIDMGAQLSALIAEALEFETSFLGGPDSLESLHATVANARTVVMAFEFIREDVDLDDRGRRDVYLSARRRFEATQDTFVVLRHVASGMFVLEPVD